MELRTRGASEAGFYYDFDPAGAATRKDDDKYEALDVLAREVTIFRLLSDPRAIVTDFASCMDLNLHLVKRGAQREVRCYCITTRAVTAQPPR